MILIAPSREESRRLIDEQDRQWFADHPRRLFRVRYGVPGGEPAHKGDMVLQLRTARAWLSMAIGGEIPSGLPLAAATDAELEKVWRRFADQTPSDDRLYCLAELKRALRDHKRVTSRTSRFPNSAG